MIIKKLKAREILDSRGLPTVECCLELSDGHSVKASVPSGKSVGYREAHELRDEDKNRFNGEGVLKAIKNIETKIAPLILGKQADLLAVDQAMIALDGTNDKKNLGANAMLAVSMAVCRAQAYGEKLELYTFLQNTSNTKKIALPQCMFNIINGGGHADTDLPIQEMMVLPQKRSVSDQVEAAMTIFQSLRRIFNWEGYGTNTGDEGGFAPYFRADPEGIPAHEYAFKSLQKAINEAKRKDIAIAIDVAASNMYEDEKLWYRYDFDLRLDEMVEMYDVFADNYDVTFIEDGLSEIDIEGWKKLKEVIGDRVKLVGDDLFVSNKKYIEKYHDLADAVIIKPNQVGTVSQSIEAVKMARSKGLSIIVSHRSGETNDTFIADLAVGVAADFFKAGGPSRGERVCKYNRLMEIERGL